MDLGSFTAEDIYKVAGGGGTGAGLMALIVRFLQGSIKRVEKRQDDLEDKLGQHELNDVSNYATRSEIDKLREHMDASFRDQRDFMMSLFNRKP